jgi:transcriptional regulator with XRE-family HTH domain
MARQKHRLMERAREERLRANLSLARAAKKSGMREVRLGSYERGDRQPNLFDVDEVFAPYGLQVGLEPIGAANGLDRETVYRLIELLQKAVEPGQS